MEELEAEGVEVSTGRTGDMRVNLAQWGWFPQVGSIDLPQVVADADAEGADESDE